jgi:hypothetical protein
VNIIDWPKTKRVLKRLDPYHDWQLDPLTGLVGFIWQGCLLSFPRWDEIGEVRVDFKEYYKLSEESVALLELLNGDPE